MHMIHHPRQMLEAAAELRAAGDTIGLVPTMGFLHEGHLNLIDRLRPLVKQLWLSIFVNPAQFGPKEDLDSYPRDLERDLELCRSRGVDGVFVPLAQDIYPPDYQTWVVPGAVADRYCGASRPGHFRGVLSIVHRLFRWSRCTHAIFGAKDAQQLWLIQRMNQDLELGVTILEGEIMREADGLAMSSRNVYLNDEERAAAPALQKALKAGAAALSAGLDPDAALAVIHESLQQEALFQPEYLHVADWSTLNSLSGWPHEPGWQGDSPVAKGGEIVLLAAARLGKTRLIDNLRIKGME
jgi:pantoate--beta-alanine ligase